MQLKILCVVLLISLSKCVMHKTSPRPLHDSYNDRYQATNYNDARNQGNIHKPGISMAYQQKKFLNEKHRNQKLQTKLSQQRSGEMDSYMKAYHDEQEKYRKGIERQQTLRDGPSKNVPKIADNSRWWKKHQQIRNKRVFNPQQAMRISQPIHNNKPTYENVQYYTPKDQSVGEQIKYTSIIGSSDPHTFTNGFKYNAGFVQQSPVDHGNVGIQIEHLEQINPVHYDVSQDYRTGSNVEALSALIGKKPSEQLQGFHALLQNTNEPSIRGAFDQSSVSVDYGQGNNQYSYGGGYGQHMQIKQQIPITEHVMEEPHAFVHVGATVPTQAPVEESTQYYKVDVASHVISQNLKANDEFLRNQNLKLESTPQYGSDDDNLHYAAQYEFGYRVRDAHSGNDFGHQEAKDGEATKGHYHVLLPDGRLQNVLYWAGPSGYHAQVSYDLVR